MTFDITGKPALVTGANRGIGKAIAEGFLAAGASKVYAAVRDPASADGLVQEHGEKIVPLAFDLSKPDTIAAAAGAAADAHCVVNNGGVLRNETTLSEGALDALRFELDVNLYGLIHTARAFAPILKANGGGAFVQLNSVVSIKTFAGVTTYSASKAAAYAITQSLRQELKEQGTQVVSVHPGPIETDMAKSAGLTDMDPPSVVADAILDAFRTGAFHVFPDKMAKEMFEAYASFAENVVEAEMTPA